VRHEGKGVVLSQPRHYEPLRTTEFEIDVRVPIDEYRVQVVALAQAARDFYLASGARSVEVPDMDFHEQFWTDFDGRLERANLDLDM
jgi:hypothetical protein